MVDYTATTATDVLIRPPLFDSRLNFVILIEEKRLCPAGVVIVPVWTGPLVADIRR